MSAGDVQPPWSSPTGTSNPPPGRRRRRHPAARSRVAVAALSGGAFVAGTVGLWITQTVADADPDVATTTTVPATAPSATPSSAPATTTPTTSRATAPSSSTSSSTTVAARLAPSSRRPADTSSHGS
jgi:hypothetical protein